MVQRFAAHPFDFSLVPVVLFLLYSNICTLFCCVCACTCITFWRIKMSIIVQVYASAPAFISEEINDLFTTKDTTKTTKETFSGCFWRMECRNDNKGSGKVTSKFRYRNQIECGEIMEFAVEQMFILLKNFKRRTVENVCRVMAIK